MRAEALEVHPHPNVAMTGYAAQGDCVSDVKRIAHWFSHPRRVNKSVSRKRPEDGASRSSSSTEPLLDAATVKNVLDIVQEPMLSSLLR